MRKLLTMLAVAGMTLGTATAAAAAEQHGVHRPDHPHHHEHLHGHIKLIGLTFEGGEPVMYRKCIELPVTPSHAHHEKKHIGGAHGPNQMVIPGPPLSPFESCAAFAAIVGPPNTYIPPEG